MDRRGFLTTLFGATSAAILLPRIDLAIARQATALTNFKEMESLCTYTEALREAHRLFSGDMFSRGFDIRPEHTDLQASRIGENTAAGITMMTQRSIMVASTDPASCLIPAMYAMSGELANRGIDRFGTLMLPRGVTFAGTRGPLRMIVQWDIEENTDTIRFDVLGGSSPIGQRIAQKYRNDWTKTFIRSRLGTYRNPSRLPV